MCLAQAVLTADSRPVSTVLFTGDLLPHNAVSVPPFGWSPVLLARGSCHDYPDP